MVGKGIENDRAVTTAGLRRSTAALAALGLVGILVTAACTSGGASGHPLRSSGAPARSPVVTSCPVTVPNGQAPPTSILTSGESPNDPTWHGNGTLWTSLPLPLPSWRDKHNGLVSQKASWWRVRPGQVYLNARPVAGSSAIFQYHVSDSPGPGVVTSTLQFGKTGCWRLFARLGPSTLVLVIDVPEPVNPLDPSQTK